MGDWRKPSFELYYGPNSAVTSMAATFALHFTGRGMMALYQESQKKMAGDVGKMSSTKRGPSPEELFPTTDLLADLHATSCGLKALASTTAAEGLEVCRRACGGHGYSSFSGIGSWYADYLPTTTWEGDNYMLTQQVARYVSSLPFSVATCHLRVIAPEISACCPSRQGFRQRY